MFFDSGDFGVAGPPYNSKGIGLDGCLGPNHTVYSPNFPDVCPWVTAVGGTMINTTAFALEVAVSSGPPNLYGPFFFSGGGFSNGFPAPHYQQRAMRDFFTRADPSVLYYTNGINGFDGNDTGAGGPGYKRTDGLYNRNGRAYPDVAANGAFLTMVEFSQVTISSSTSAATPHFASFIHRVNIARERAGKSPVGFINPVVYKHPEILKDIVSGSIQASVHVISFGLQLFSLTLRAA
jgi:tripeptidyl-peptidase-1